MLADAASRVEHVKEFSVQVLAFRVSVGMRRPHLPGAKPMVPLLLASWIICLPSPKGSIKTAV